MIVEVEKRRSGWKLEIARVSSDAISWSPDREEKVGGEMETWVTQSQVVGARVARRRFGKQGTVQPQRPRTRRVARDLDQPYEHPRIIIPPGCCESSVRVALCLDVVGSMRVIAGVDPLQGHGKLNTLHATA